MRRLWLGDGLMEVWRAQYDRISGEEFAWDRDSLTNVGPVCGPSGWISALEVGGAVGEMGRVSGSSGSCGGDALGCGRGWCMWNVVCDAGVRDGEVPEDWFGSCMVNVCKSSKTNFSYVIKNFAPPKKFVNWRHWGDALTRGSCRDIGLLRRAVGSWEIGRWRMGRVVVVDAV